MNKRCSHFHFKEKFKNWLTLLLSVQGSKVWQYSLCISSEGRNSASLHLIFFVMGIIYNRAQRTT